METEKCGYCGRECAKEDMTTLDNGSPACQSCANEEEKKAKEKSNHE